MVARYVERHRLLPAGAPVVVAVSGGADSVALLSVLTSLGYRCVAAHCNFGLRGAESDRDEAFVRTLAATLGVPLRVKRFDTRGCMLSGGLSVEMACRELRYEWFDRLMESEQAEAIAVGHHLEDNVETLMLNLMRGTGVGGVGGMMPRNREIVRPLLECGRGDIERYLHERGLRWITDSSNASNEFKRNRLRNVVIPAWESAFAGATEAVGRSLSYIRPGVDFFNEMVEAKRVEYTDGNTIDLKRLLERERSARLLLVQWLGNEGFDAATVDRMIEASGESGRRFKGRGETWRLVDRGRLLKVGDAVAESCGQVTLDAPPFSLERIEGLFTPEESDPKVAYFSTSLLEGDPVFELRSWREGDRIAPFGMKGTKKISDLFGDLHVPDSEKKRPVVLTRNGAIIWLVGMRHSRLFSVEPGALSYLKIRFLK